MELVEDGSSDSLDKEMQNEGVNVADIQLDLAQDEKKILESAATATNPELVLVDQQTAAAETA